MARAMKISTGSATRSMPGAERSAAMAGKEVHGARPGGGSIGCGEA